MNRFIALTVAGILAIGSIALTGNQDEAVAGVRGCTGPRTCDGADDCCGRPKRERCTGRRLRCNGCSAPACCEPAPEPEVTCCEPDPCSGGILARLRARRCSGADECSEPAPTCGKPARTPRCCRPPRTPRCCNPAPCSGAAEEAGDDDGAAEAEAAYRPLTLRFVAFR